MEKYILRCIQLARQGEQTAPPNPMVGAVLVRDSDEVVIGEGWHERYGEAHAEVNCFCNAEKGTKGSLNISYKIRFSLL